MKIICVGRNYVEHIEELNNNYKTETELKRTRELLLELILEKIVHNPHFSPKN